MMLRAFAYLVLATFIFSCFNPKLITTMAFSDSSSKSPPTTTKSDDIITIQSRCNCRRVLLEISLPKEEELPSIRQNSNGSAFNCHCPSCRKYHTSAYVSYLRVQRHQISIKRGHDMIEKFVSSCQIITNTSDSNDVMERWYCTECSSKLISIVAERNKDGGVRENKGHNENCWVNMGPLNEDTIPESYSNRWKEQLKQIGNNLSVDSSSCWTHALPNYRKPQTSLSPIASPPIIWTGSCSCGSCRYQISITRAAQLQHCYCHLCRELSGGPFATWIPIYKRDFEWKKPENNESGGSATSPEQQQHHLSLVRTTPGGSRHICTKCRGILTIVYDSQPDLIWPCAGGLDDDTLPSSNDNNQIMMGTYLKRVCHICCRHLPTWLDLPNDGMERLADAC